jgi:hypothetical protein
VARTHRDRGHMPPVNGTEERLDALLDVLEEIRDQQRPAAAEERPGQVRLREGEGEAEAGPGETPAPAADDFEAGRLASLASEPRKAPFQPGRSARARRWYAGFDSVAE